MKISRKMTRHEVERMTSSQVLSEQMTGWQREEVEESIGKGHETQRIMDITSVSFLMFSVGMP